MIGSRSGRRPPPEAAGERAGEAVGIALFGGAESPGMVSTVAASRNTYSVAELVGDGDNEVVYVSEAPPLTPTAATTRWASR